MKCRALALGCALILAACVKPHGDEVKSSELKGYYFRTPGPGTVTCTAYYTLEADPLQNAVTLEDEAIVTCNGFVLTRAGTSFSGAISHISGEPVAISLIRKVDGSTLTDTQIVY